MAHLQAPPVSDHPNSPRRGLLPSITNGDGDGSPPPEENRFAPNDDEAHRDGPDQTPPPKQRSMGGGSQGGRSSASQIDATLEIA